MKNLEKKILLLILLFGSSQLFAYDLTEKDNTFIDTIEERLFTLIDNNEALTAGQVELVIEKALQQDRSERILAILEVLLDDLRYEYFLGEYSTNTATNTEKCYEDEYFDEEDQQCYFDDSEYSYEDEEDYIGDDYRDESGFEYGDHDHADQQDSNNENILATYIISGDTITLKTGATLEKYEDTWKTFATIIPASSRQDFKLYHVFDDENADTAALVEQDEDDMNKWNLTVNISAIYEGNITITTEGIATLIHEFTHVMTLNKTQMDYLPDTQDESVIQSFESSCTTNFVQEGCLNETSYLDDFIDIFWTNTDVLKKAQEDGISAYTDATMSDFITDYAGTNPGEDIAESFTYFVLNTKPTGDTIADKKLQFFYDYKELESLRKQIRTKINSLSD